MTKFLKSSFFWSSDHPIIRSSSTGFTLLEMSVVLVIIGFVAAGAMVIFTQSLATRQLNDTSDKLATIQSALYDFRVANNRIPCPADATLPLSDVYFGVEAGNAGSCLGGTPAVNFSQSASTVITGLTGGITSGSTSVTVSSTAGLVVGMEAVGSGIPTGDTISTVGSGVITLTPTAATGTGSNVSLSFYQVVEGMVPTRTLRLPDDYASDSWGHRIMYAVYTDMTQTNAFSFFPGNDTTTRITINNALGSADTSQAAYMLLSFGPDGQGSYPRSGGSTRLNALSDNADELTNCHCTQPISGVVAANNLTPMFVQKDPTLDSNDKYDSFDDILAYGTRGSLMLQPSTYWNTVSAGANTMNCPPSSNTCTTVGTIKSCHCNQ